MFDKSNKILSLPLFVEFSLDKNNIFFHFPLAILKELHQFLCLFLSVIYLSVELNAKIAMIFQLVFGRDWLFFYLKILVVCEGDNAIP